MRLSVFDPRGGWKDGTELLPDAARALAADLVRAADHAEAVDTGEWLIPRQAVIDAPRDAHRNDSAADAVEFVSDLVGWAAHDDPELQKEARE